MIDGDGQMIGVGINKADLCDVCPGRSAPCWTPYCNIDPQNSSQTLSDKYTSEVFQKTRVLTDQEFADLENIQEDAKETLGQIQMRFSEKEILEEALTFIQKSSYQQHYAGHNGIQAIDLIDSAGYGVEFCVGNAIKYLSRYGRKYGKNEKDLFKAMHYVVLAMHFERNKAD